MSGGFGLQLILTFFFMPETTYRRSAAPSISDSSPTKGSSVDEKNAVSEDVRSASFGDSLPIPERHSFMHELRPWGGYYDPSNFWYNVVAPFKMLGSPLVIWGSFQLTICMSWLVMLAITLSQIFTGPPYNFSVAAVGLTSLSSFFGTFIATALAGMMVDGLVKFMARKNHGIYGKQTH